MCRGRLAKPLAVRGTKAMLSTMCNLWMPKWIVQGATSCPGLLCMHHQGIESEERPSLLSCTALLADNESMIEENAVDEQTTTARYPSPRADGLHLQRTFLPTAWSMFQRHGGRSIPCVCPLARSNRYHAFAILSTARHEGCQKAKMPLHMHRCGLSGPQIVPWNHTRKVIGTRSKAKFAGTGIYS